MERVFEQFGKMSVSDAFALLRKGLALHIASAPEAEDVLPLRGAWKDGKGNIRYDRCAFYVQRKNAMTVARAFGQDCVFGLYPNTFGNGRVFLLKDSVRNRVLALHYAGNYVSDGEHLLIHCLGDELPFEPIGEVFSLPTDLVLTFAVPTHTHTHAPAPTPAHAPTRGQASASAGTGAGTTEPAFASKTEKPV